MKKILFIVVFFLLLANFVNAQNIDKISLRCRTPFQSTFATILINNLGDIVHTPCNSRASIFNGNVDFTGAVVSGVVNGSGTTNFIPRFTTTGVPSTIGNTPFSWDATDFLWNNTALNAQFTMDLLPSVAGGRFRVGDFTTTPTTFIDVNQTADTIAINTAANSVTIGDTVGFLTQISITPSSGSITNRCSATGTCDIGGAQTRLLLQSTTDQLITNIATWDLSDTSGLTGVNVFKLQRTNTAAGTTGAQTINKPNGSVNFAAAATAITVTNSTAAATSNISATAQTNDATCAVKNVVPAAGSFVINMTAACTAETRVAFWVWN